MANEEGEQGMSTPKKVVAGAALGVAIPAAVAGARKLISGESSGGKERESSKKPERPKRSTRRPRTAAKNAKKRTTAAKKKTTSRATRTREQLYRQATRLKIPGRSRMTKSQLERAVDRVRGRS